jgi:hypothetical protein
MESNQKFSTQDSSSGALLMNAEAKAIGKIHSKFKFECWRRRQDCNCQGCSRWGIMEAYRNDSAFFINAEAPNYSAEEQQCEYRTLAWQVEEDNIVVTVGKNDILTQYFKGSAYTAAWFIGLVDGGSSPTYAAADTMASHSGWTENQNYSQGTRPAWVGGTAAAGAIDNSASVAVYSINNTATIAGAFSVTNSTKGGTTGTLYSEVNFTQGSRAVLNGDTLNVTQQFTVV